MDKLGFTFYPKDWWTSDTFFEFEPIERYIFLECIFLMYQNNGYLEQTKQQIETRLRLKIKPSIWEKITQLFTHTDLGFTLDSVKKRRSKADVSRENGKKGGRPKKTQKPSEKPKKNPPLEREREDEIERESEYNIKDIFQTIPDFIYEHYTDEQTHQRTVILAEEMLNSDMFIEQVARMLHKEVKIAKDELKQFLRDIEVSRECYQSLSKVKTHFKNYMKVKYGK